MTICLALGQMTLLKETLISYSWPFTSFLLDFAKNVLHVLGGWQIIWAFSQMWLCVFTLGQTMLVVVFGIPLQLLRACWEVWIVLVRVLAGGGATASTAASSTWVLLKGEVMAINRVAISVINSVIGILCKFSQHQVCYILESWSAQQLSRENSHVALEVSLMVFGCDPGTSVLWLGPNISVSHRVLLVCEGGQRYSLANVVLLVRKELRSLVGRVSTN